MNSCVRHDYPFDPKRSIITRLDEAIWEAKRFGHEPKRILLGMWKWYQLKDALTMLPMVPDPTCTECRYQGILLERGEVPGIIIES